MVKNSKKLLSLLLTAAMLASLVVVPAFADNETGAENSDAVSQSSDGSGEGGEDLTPVPPVCTCNAAEGESHTKGCPLYVAPECTCNAAEGQPHAENCPLYVKQEQATEPEITTTPAAEDSENNKIATAPAVEDDEDVEQPAADQVPGTDSTTPSEPEQVNEPAAEEPAADNALEPQADEEEPVIPEGAIKVGADEEIKTLADAVDAANNRAEKAVTIALTSNLTETECARIQSKDVTILGNGYTVARGEKFDTISDNARSWYNPAMIEVCDNSHTILASLRLENITLDDGGKTAGTKYSQASTDGKGGNGDIVQDAIIATYDGVGTITLGKNVTLKGYGGMSAVRLSGGTLVMEAGSTITGGKDFTTKGGGNGPAGAVWIQGGTFTMNKDASIDGVVGRAVYIDSGSATINGTISNITANNNMWQGQSGVAIHVRNKGYAVLGETGVIDGIKGNGGGYTGAVMTNSSRVTQEALNEWLEDDSSEVLWDFEAKSGSIIRNVTGFPTIYSNWGTELLNGTITGCQHDFIIGGFAQKTVIGKTGVIESCTAKDGAANAIVYTSNASKIFHYGKVRNNTASHAFYIINQSGGGASLDMYNGALISNTSGDGVYINASECALYMHGGTITGNGSYGAYIREKGDRSATMVMDGGEITNNKSYGVYYSGSSGNKQGYINLNGGKISGNGSDYGPYQISISGSYARDDKVRAHIAPGVVQAGNGRVAAVSTSFGTLTLDSNYDDIYLGNAKSAASGKIKTLAEEYDTKGAYTTAGYSALWFKPTMDTLHFTASRNSSVNPSNYLKVGYIPLKADGTPADDAELKVLDMDNTNPVDVTLTKLDTSKSYALMWVVPDENATGALKLVGTESVEEVEDQTDPYQVGYTLTYQPKNFKSSIKKDDIFTVTVTLDPNLIYDNEGAGKISLNKFSLNYYEQVGEPVYDAEKHTVTLNFKALKDNVSGTATIELSTTFDGQLFNRNVKELHTGAALTLGENASRLNLKTNLDCITKLVSRPVVIPTYTVTFNWANGGTASYTVQQNGTVTAPSVPTYTSGNYRYTFSAWSPAFNPTVTGNVTYTAQYSSTYIGGTGGGGGGGGTTIIDEEVPLAGNVQLNKDDHFAYVSGYEDSTVRPNNSITREEVAAIFYRLLTEESRAIYETDLNTFSDVTIDRWSNRAISTLANAGVLSGYPDGTFRPGQTITRAEFAAIVTQFDVVTDGVENPFTDTTGHWAENLISFAASKGWVSGYADGTFLPQKAITRAEAMTLTNNVLERKVDEQGLLAGARQWPDNQKSSWYYYEVLEATNSHDYTRRSEGSLMENWTALTNG